MFRELNEEDLDSVILRRDVLAAGYDDRYVRRMLRTGIWQKIRHGAYVPTSVLSEVGPQSRHRLLARAVLRTHEGAVLSHVSAAVELGAPTWRIDLGLVHVTRLDGMPARRQAGVVQHCGRLEPHEVLELRGVHLTTGTRAALEVITMTGVASALVTVNGLLHNRATTMSELQAASPLLRNWPNSLTAGLVLGLANPAIASAGESRLYHLCWRAGLPMPQAQVSVTGLDRGFRAYVDFAWPDLGVFMEFDGREKYSRFRHDGETLEQFVMREKRREELVCQLTGWVCIRITWQDLNTPARTIRRIRDLLGSRAAFVRTTRAWAQ